MRLTKERDRLKAEIERSKGAKEILMEKLQKDFKCDSFEQGQKLLGRLIIRNGKTAERIDRLLEEMEEAIGGDKGED